VRDVPKILRALAERGVDFSFRFAGDGPLREELQASVQAESRTCKAEFLGVLSSDELTREIYNWTDVLLVTSSWETGPIVIWEAMIHGIPVVTSAYVGSIAEGSLIDRQNCLMFPVGNCPAAAAAISALAEPSLRATLIENAFKLVQTKYTKRASVNAWSSGIEKLMELPVLCERTARQPLPSGRLDRLLGGAFGENLRRILRREFRHSTPGSEWPHSHSNTVSDEAFLSQVAEAERRAAKA
jgi:hypothetical protein